MLDAFPRLLYFQKKNIFTGDHHGMRIRMCAVQPEEGERVLRAWVWEEPLCFAAASADACESADFPLTQEGHDAACDWVRQRYQAEKPRWQQHYTKPRT